IEVATERLEAFGSDAARLRAALASAEVERDRAVADVQGAAAARTTLEETLARTLEESRVRTQTLTGRLEEREHDLARLEEERAAETGAASTRIDTITAELDELHRLAGELEAERDRRSAEVEGSAAERAREIEPLRHETAEPAIDASPDKVGLPAEIENA